MKYWCVGAFLLIFSHPALADTMTAEQPGVMCKDASALAALTLPDGSARPGEDIVEAKGGCVDIPIGATVEVQTRRHNTSIVTYSGANGPQTFYVPNIDFSAPGKSSNPACLPYNTPLPFVGVITIGKDYGEQMNGTVGWASWMQLTLPRPICTIADEANAEDPETDVKDMQYMSQNNTNIHFHVGQRISVVGELNASMNLNWNTPVFIDIRAVK